MTVRRSVGVIGGGQLARMMIPAAVSLGVDIRVLAEVEGASAGLAASVVGDYRDRDTVLAFADTVDVVTFDHEHVPQPILREMVSRGVRVHPGPDALRYAQDKLAMRTRLAELGLPMPAWARIDSSDDLADFLDAHDGRVVVKTARGGYDGKGVRVVSDAHGADDWLAEVGRGLIGDALLAEELVDFERELSQQVARRESSQTLAWPLVETIQRDGVCAEVLAPAPVASSETAREAADVAARVAEGVGVTGALAVEMFETREGRVLVNELAMRPHNSGHWSIEGAVTSQFEQHLRAVLDLPLGDASARAPWTVMVNILGGPREEALQERYPAMLEAHPDVKVHAYGKTSRPGRKVGHVTAFGDDLDEVIARARGAAGFFEDADLT